MVLAIPLKAKPLSAEELHQNERIYWQAANYLSVGQIYLLDNTPWETQKIGASSPEAIRSLGDYFRGRNLSTSTTSSNAAEHYLHLGSSHDGQGWLLTPRGHL